MNVVKSIFMKFRVLINGLNIGTNILKFIIIDTSIDYNIETSRVRLSNGGEWIMLIIVLILKAGAPYVGCKMFYHTALVIIILICCFLFQIFLMYDFL